MFKRIEIGIAGKEFGFDYLSTAKEIASSLGLVGVAFEKKDGSIKLIAEGEETSLMDLVNELDKGGFNHTVENFYIKWDEAKGGFKDFSISATPVPI